MSMVSSYQSQVSRIQKEIAQLQDNVGREAKNIADLRIKINTANRSLLSTKSESTAKSKLSEINRHQDNIARAEKKRADLEGKIARKTAELNRAKENLYKEEQKETNKRQSQQEQSFKKINKNLQEYGHQINETVQAIQRLQQPVDTITVLFLASNPLDQMNLQLDEEIRSIDEMIRKSEHRDAVNLVSKWAVRPADVLQGLNQYSPQVVHISGHGASSGEIVFQQDDGNTKLVSIDAMIQLMVASSSSIRFVFFNSCYSSSQAKAIVEHIEATVGMRAAIGDKAARIFASQFYSAIGFGKSVKVAFEQAKALLMMEGIREEDTPELFVADGLNADDIILVTPPEKGGIVKNS